MEALHVWDANCMNYTFHILWSIHFGIQLYDIYYMQHPSFITRYIFKNLVYINCVLLREGSKWLD